MNDQPTVIFRDDFRDDPTREPNAAEVAHALNKLAELWETMSEQYDRGAANGWHYEGEPLDIVDAMNAAHDAYQVIRAYQLHG